VLQHLDGRLEVRYQGLSLVIFQPATNEPVRVGKFKPAPAQVAPKSIPQLAKPSQTPKQRLPYKPPANHPWRQYDVGLKKGT
jgi:hypothetical protein